MREYFKSLGAQDKIMEFDVSSATVDLAAKAVGCEGKQIAKSLSFDVRGQTVLVVVAGDKKIDNAKYKVEFQTKATMLSPLEVELRVGHKVGGVCPFKLKKGVRVFLDVSLKRFDFVYPACGTANSAIKLTVGELEKFSNYEKWVDVSKDIV